MVLLIGHRSLVQITEVIIFSSVNIMKGWQLAVIVGPIAREVKTCDHLLLQARGHHRKVQIRHEASPDILYYSGEILLNLRLLFALLGSALLASTATSSTVGAWQ